MATAISFQPHFRCGELVTTVAVDNLIQQGRINARRYFERHLKGDWGDISERDWRANEDALRNGERLSSSYQVAPELKLLIITEWDRSVTTVQLSDEI